MKGLITPKFTMKKELYWQRVRGICILSVIGILPQKMASSLGMS